MRLSLSLVLLCVTSAAEADFVLVDVEAGLQPATVVVFPDAPPTTREAAIDLADYVEICCTRPDLIDKVPDDIPYRAIWVGYQKALDPLFPDVDFAFKHPVEVRLLSRRRGHQSQCGSRSNAPTKHLRS